MCMRFVQYPYFWPKISSNKKNWEPRKPCNSVMENTEVRKYDLEMPVPQSLQIP